MLLYEKKQTNTLILLFCISLLLLISGCASQSQGSRSKLKDFSESERRIIESTAEELVEPPDLPSDDGIPLTQEEKIALHSTGELDRYLTLEQKQQVEMHFKTYLHRGRKRFTNYLERAQIYLPLVKTIFKEMGVPEDIAYLAFVESGFNPNAVSSAGATGMWQFMRYTGKRYGLAQNAWIDERRDPHKATVAAALYLNQLYEHFGDWLLAVAAYNAGEGKIMRAMESTGAGDFFELCLLNDNIQEDKRKLRSETQQYVPTFLAVVKIMRNLELLGFNAQALEQSEQLTTLRLPPNTDLRALASNLGMKMETFQALNPAFRKDVSLPNSVSTAYIPIKYEAQALAWLNSPKATRTATYENYKVRKGDTLSSIANKFNVSVDLIKQSNGLKSTKLSIGTNLKIPSTGAPIDKGSSSKTLASSTAGKAKTETQTTKATTHTVKTGETLFSISRKYGVNIDDLRSANKITAKTNKLSVGQRLTIPGKTTQASAPSSKPAAQAQKPASQQAKTAAQSTKPAVQQQSANRSGSSSAKTHLVKSGDTLFSLARTYKVSLDDLRKANGFTEKTVLKSGQTLRIP